MKAQTFTVLVTVVHDDKQGHSQSRISEMIQQALENGTEDYASFSAAVVDAFKGDLIGTGASWGTSADQERYQRVLPLHTDAAK